MLKIEIIDIYETVEMSCFLKTDLPMKKLNCLVLCHMSLFFLFIFLYFAFIINVKSI